MTLIYTARDPEPYEIKFAETLEGTVDFRTARLWRGEIEKADAVYTDDERIKEAYSKRGITVRPIATRKPSKTLEAKSTTPKRTTRKPTKK